MWTHDEAAKVMGMAPHEILAVAEVGDVHVVTTHDGQHTLVTDEGDATLLDKEQAAAMLAAQDNEKPGVDGNGDGVVDDTNGDGVPDGKAEEILAWVGEDTDRAAQALAAEQGKDKPRATLVAALQKVAPAS